MRLALVASASCARQRAYAPLRFGTKKAPTRMHTRGRFVRGATSLRLRITTQASGG